jgi:subtilisin family serine protease
VLSVSAIGSLAELRADSWEATQVVQRLVANDGIFSPNFTCFGPEVAVCGPGVSIISSVPGAAYEPQSGTSMAAPHVTGLAALLLAHHPALRGTRGADRVRALFDTIRSISVPLTLGRDRTGAGLPRLTGLASILQPNVSPVRTVVSVPAAPSPGPGPGGSLAPAAAGPTTAPTPGVTPPAPGVAPPAPGVAPPAGCIPVNPGAVSVTVPALQPFWFLGI